jgi:hypothetical protein
MEMVILLLYLISGRQVAREIGCSHVDQYRLDDRVAQGRLYFGSAGFHRLICTTIIITLHPHEHNLPFIGLVDTIELGQ